jgi:hypothetical protein
MKSGLLKVWREYRGFAVFVVLMVIFRSALATGTWFRRVR